MLDELRKIFGSLSTEVFLVGGVVRDMLDGLNPDDIDLVAKIPAERILALGAKYVDPKMGFPVFVLRHEKLGKIDIALPRSEKKTGPGHRGFAFDHNHQLPIEQDLARRDFTINSMAMTLDGTLIDPFGGKDDLEAGILRHTGDAFLEDSLRVYRALRFTTLGYKLHKDTIDIVKTVDTSDIPPERIYHEMIKALKGDYPHMFFKHMVGFDICKDRFGVIHRMTGVPAGPHEFHPVEDVFTHCLNTLREVSLFSQSAVTRLSAFLHDVGKIETPKDTLPHHYRHEIIGPRIVYELLSSLRAPNRVTRAVSCVVKNHMKILRIKEMRPGKKLQLVKEVLDNKCCEAIIDVAKADVNRHIGRLAQKEMDKAKSVLRMNVSDLGLDTETLKNKEGNAISETVLAKRVTALKKLG
jgi:tRNA nucleotidyltransferase (CCA-adding enzyme)